MTEAHRGLLQQIETETPLTDEERRWIVAAFRPQTLKRKTFFLEAGQTCRFIAYLHEGVARHFHLKDGREVTCDITLAGAFLTDMNSFANETPSPYFFQTLQHSELLLVRKTDLRQLYQRSRAAETFGRIMAERVAQRSIQTAMSLASETPEERVVNLLRDRPDLFQEVPQRYLAHLVGISPESFSRIRGRLAGKS